MKRPTITIHDLETNKIETREMNDEEFAQYEKEIAESQVKQNQAAAKAAEKDALLAKLGITADEAKLLLA